MSRFDDLDGRAVQMGAQQESMIAKLDDVMAGAEREASAVVVFRAGVGEIGELARRVEERVTAIGEMLTERGL